MSTIEAADRIETVEAAVRAVTAGLGPLPRVPLAIVTGSGLGGLSDLGRTRATIEYAAIPGLGAGTVAGHAGRWLLLETAAGPVHCLAGRRHVYEGIDPWATGLLLRVAARLGAERVLLTNAAGGLTGRLTPGDLMLVADHINGMLLSPLRGGRDPRPGAQRAIPRAADDRGNCEMGREFERRGRGNELDQTHCATPAYDPAMREALREAARRESIALKEGIYLALTGPSYETPAEVRLLRRMGADAVGMSTVPETLAAREAGLRVAAISLITNSHVQREKTTHEEVLKRGQAGAGRLLRLIETFLESGGGV